MRCVEVADGEVEDGFRAGVFCTNFRKCSLFIMPTDVVMLCSGLSRRRGCRCFEILSLAERNVGLVLAPSRDMPLEFENQSKVMMIDGLSGK